MPRSAEAPQFPDSLTLGEVSFGSGWHGWLIANSRGTWREESLGLVLDLPPDLDPRAVILTTAAHDHLLSNLGTLRDSFGRKFVRTQATWPLDPAEVTEGQISAVLLCLTAAALRLRDLGWSVSAAVDGDIRSDAIGRPVFSGFANVVPVALADPHTIAAMILHLCAAFPACPAFIRRQASRTQTLDQLAEFARQVQSEIEPESLRDARDAESVAGQIAAWKSKRTEHRGSLASTTIQAARRLITSCDRWLAALERAAAIAVARRADSATATQRAHGRMRYAVATVAGILAFAIGLTLLG